MQDNAPSANDRRPSARALLFDANGEDRPVEDPHSLDLAGLTDKELAWIDIISDGQEATEALMRELGLEPHLIAPLFDTHGDPLVMRKDWYAVRAIAPHWVEKEANVHGTPWLLVVGPNVVFTAHRDPIRSSTRSSRNTTLPRTSATWTRTPRHGIVDRMLTAYHAALDAFEARVDHMEVAMLRGHVHDGFAHELGGLRRAVARFRRLLGSHRGLFDALRRADFRPEQDQLVQKRFRAVSDRYERAMDAVENARDLVVGSFELLDTRLSQRTNETMRLLTFVTVLLGTLAVVAGMLGMNFHASLFDSGTRGFWVAVGAMVAVPVLALVLARWRGWWK